MADEPLDGPVELTLPADSRLVRLVRLLASGLASTAGFDLNYPIGPKVSEGA